MNFTARNGVGVGEKNATKIVTFGSDRLEVQGHRMRRHLLCRRQAGLHCASWTTRLQLTNPLATSSRRHSQPIDMARLWRVPNSTALDRIGVGEDHRLVFRCHGDSLCGLSLSKSINSRILSRFDGLFTGKSCRDWKTSDFLYECRPLIEHSLLILGFFVTNSSRT